MAVPVKGAFRERNTTAHRGDGEGRGHLCRGDRGPALTWGHFNEEDLTEVPDELHGRQDGDLRRDRGGPLAANAPRLTRRTKEQGELESREGQHAVSIQGSAPAARKGILGGGSRTNRLYFSGGGPSLMCTRKNN